MIQLYGIPIKLPHTKLADILKYIKITIVFTIIIETLKLITLNTCSNNWTLKVKYTCNNRNMSNTPKVIS